jgi:hypothetical protein
MKQIVRATLKALRKGQGPEVVEIKTQREPQLDDLHRGSEPEKSQEPAIVEFKTDEPQLDYPHNGRQPEMVEFAIQHEPQLDGRAVQQTLPATTLEERGDATPERVRGRDEARWLEERPKIVEAIKSGVAALRETSAQMRANQATRRAAKTDTNLPSAGTSTAPAVRASPKS